AASSCVISPRSCRSSKLEKRIRRTPSCIDAVLIVPSLFRAPKTRHFTSYKQATDHALATYRTQAGFQTTRTKIGSPQREGSTMRRREFIAGLGSTAAWPTVARAQQVRRVGMLLPYAVGRW